MPWSLRRFQNSGQLHFVTFSCYRRQPLLTPAGRTAFERALERARTKYGFLIALDGAATRTARHCSAGQGQVNCPALAKTGLGRGTRLTTLDDGG